MRSTLLRLKEPVFGCIGLTSPTYGMSTMDRKSLPSWMVWWTCTIVLTASKNLSRSNRVTCSMRMWVVSMWRIHVFHHEFWWWKRKAAFELLLDLMRLAYLKNFVHASQM